MSEQTPAERLKQRIAELEPLGKPDGSTWYPLRKQLRHEMQKGDPAEILNWGVVRSTLMEHGPTPMYVTYMSYLEARLDWNSCWRSVLDGVPLPWANQKQAPHANALRHLYEASLLEGLSDRPLSEFSLVVEFGGGLGDMCRVLRGVGFCGPHVILDFPELCALQEYYLTLSGIPVFWGSWPNEGGGAGLYSEVGALLRDLDDRHGGLLLASHSLEEASLSARESFSPAMHNRNLYFLNYSSVGRHSDGAKWIAAFSESEADVVWEESSFGYSPGNKLLTGRRKL